MRDRLIENNNIRAYTRNLIKSQEQDKTARIELEKMRTSGTYKALIPTASLDVWKKFIDSLNWEQFNQLYDHINQSQKTNQWRDLFKTDEYSQLLKNWLAKKDSFEEALKITTINPHKQSELSILRHYPAYFSTLLGKESDAQLIALQGEDLVKDNAVLKKEFNFREEARKLLDYLTTNEPYSEPLAEQIKINNENLYNLILSHPIIFTDFKTCFDKLKILNTPVTEKIFGVDPKQDHNIKYVLPSTVPQFKDLQTAFKEALRDKNVLKNQRCFIKATTPEDLKILISDSDKDKIIENIINLIDRNEINEADLQKDYKNLYDAIPEIQKSLTKRKIEQLALEGKAFIETIDYFTTIEKYNRFNFIDKVNNIKDFITKNNPAELALLIEKYFDDQETSQKEAIKTDTLTNLQANINQLKKDYLSSHDYRNAITKLSDAIDLFLKEKPISENPVISASDSGEAAGKIPPQSPVKPKLPPRPQEKGSVASGPKDSTKKTPAGRPLPATPSPASVAPAIPAPGSSKKKVRRGSVASESKKDHRRGSLPAIPSSASLAPAIPAPDEENKFIEAMEAIIKFKHEKPFQIKENTKTKLKDNVSFIQKTGKEALKKLLDQTSNRIELKTRILQDEKSYGAEYKNLFDALNEIS